MKVQVLFYLRHSDSQCQKWNPYFPVLQLVFSLSVDMTLKWGNKKIHGKWILYFYFLGLMELISTSVLIFNTLNHSYYCRTVSEKHGFHTFGQGDILYRAVVKISTCSAELNPKKKKPVMQDGWWLFPTFIRYMIGFFFFLTASETKMKSRTKASSAWQQSS